MKIMLVLILGLAAVFAQARELDTFWSDLEKNSNESWGRNLLWYRTLNVAQSNPEDQDGNTIDPAASAITALTPAADGFVYGGTSSREGISPHLFRVNITRMLVDNLWKLPGALGRDSFLTRLAFDIKNGYIYGSTSIFEEFVIGEYSSRMFKSPQELTDSAYTGGRLFRFKPADFGNDGKIQDLGPVQKFAGVRTIIINRDGRFIYGLLEPGYDFFVYDVEREKSRIIPIPSLHFVKGHENIFRRGRSLAMDTLGFVYGSAARGQLFQFNPVTSEIRVLNLFLPHMVAREEYNAVDAMVTHPATGHIWGGTELDGYLFHFDPYRMEIFNHGKPIPRPRIRGLCVGADGDLYGFAGDEAVINQFFRYDPATGSFKIFGGVESTVVREGNSKYRFHNIGVCVTHPSTGTIVFGESQRLGRIGLFISPPVIK